MTNLSGHTRTEEVGPSIPAVLFNTADVIVRGLPDPLAVEVSVRFGLAVDLATHVDLRVWADRLGLSVYPWRSQPYIGIDGVLCQLTNVTGTWRGGPVRLHCLEPVDAMAALRDEVDP
ncbi:hypothetical protein [Phytohabitans rumicis]|uniref:Uncharacterized protein n=1 Tax=Phytohabitans rumicis TaxID=1076125 RepID=A0A6V8LAG6_9ACTN|nr:hypothetical protein [Phytohabitans rumicis]GFJ91057.1 hypothetical protein Prum_046990 [Phytohabitans rumicis]